MSGPEHYAAAEKRLEQLQEALDVAAGSPLDEQSVALVNAAALAGAAQAHATLALAAVTADVEALGDNAPEWVRVTT